MFDIILRYCGYGEWLPIIQAGETRGRFETGDELYRGDRLRSREAAFEKALAVWDGSETGNIVEFKRAAGIA